ncbi:alkene reductase [Dyadobacter psychrophilus]|uniref:N-ethylmaleimide reductase n=1 Tax=Dyadobacter psychrophilus TaxID=651661 RepID=A0A1T5E684_9BACT|nr:alkene reductase [Dyadobacter psychrophilus]SKB79401.1 N-ethylmaleimide reductase [Dyadobacter psychrophilus]
MNLLSEIKLGNNVLKNRMAMAPMTRSRASNDGVVNALTVLYYTQRASAGLIVTEGINISEQAKGSPATPGIFTKTQIDAWKKVTEAVHQNGSVIYAQLWHTGRVGHTSVRNGALPVAPSALAIEGQQHFTGKGMVDYETPVALSYEEIKQVIQDYRQAAVNAMEAGFDGVELHAAFGYLPNQFLAESANQRTDDYGGSVENRNRFTLEVMQALVDAVGADKAGIKLSPAIPYNNITHQEPIPQFTALIEGLDEMPLAYIHFMNAGFPVEKFPHYPQNILETFGKLTRHTVIGNMGYTRESGEEELEKGIAKMISYGVLFLANPDLPKRFELNAELNEADRNTMYGGDEHGYTDYPFLNAAREVQA